VTLGDPLTRDGITNVSVVFYTLTRSAAGRIVFAPADARISSAISAPETHLLHHLLDLHSLLEMIQLMRPNPPFGRLHQQLGVIIFVREESVEGESDTQTFIRNFAIADFHDFLPQAGSHSLILCAIFNPPL
jgi:hypothetical protein